MNRIWFILLLFLVGCNAPKPSITNEEHQLNHLQTQYLYYQRVDVQKAQVYNDSIRQLAENTKSDKGLAMYLLNQGTLEQIKGNYDLAINKNEAALVEFEKLKNDTLIAKTNAALGTNYWQKGEYDQAMQHHLIALKLNEQLGIKSEMAVCYNYISMVYQSKYQLALAEEYIQKAFQIIQTLQPKASHISIYHNMANIYGMQAKYEDALKMDSIGLKMCEELKIEFNKSMFYDNIANCYYYSNHFDQSIAYHLKAISIDSTFKNNKQLGDSYCNLGAVYEALEKYDTAIYYYQKSIELCRKSGYKLGVKNGYELLSALYDKINQPALAYQALLNSNAVKDSMINEKTENKLAQLRTLYETEKKEQQIIQQDLKISRRNLLIGTLFIIFLLSLFTYYFLYSRYKLKQERKLQTELLIEEEKRTLAILESEENERQRLARELHDGVGQLLSATKLNLSSIEINEQHKLQNSIDILDESIKEIRNISHNMVPDILNKNGLQIAIENFIQKINQTKKIQLYFECNGFIESSLNSTEKLMLYRIIQEAVQNTLKYAQATEMQLQLSADEHEISLLLQDNGKGFDIVNTKELNGIGIRNMKLRTDYLKGNFEIESSPKNGTTIIVEIPIS